MNLAIKKRPPFDPKEPWLEKLKFRPPSARNSAFIRYHIDRGVSGENVKFSKRISTKNFNLSASFQRYVVNGVVIRCYSRNQVAKLFKVTPITVLNWINSGVMPKPFVTNEMSDGRKIPLWTTSQCMAMAKVVDQFYKEGFRVIPWHHYPQAARMMKRAGEVGVTRTMIHVDAMLRSREKKEIKKARPKYGVQFD